MISSMYQIFTFFFVLIFSTSYAYTLPKDLDTGDRYYKQREKTEYAYQALAFYQKYLDTHPNDVEGLWRASMGNYYVGHLLDEEKLRIKHYKLGVEQGKQCVKRSSVKKVECYFWLATNTALMKKEYGVLSLVFGIGGIIDIFEDALKIDPMYAQAGPYRMLALIYYKAPGFLGGDVKKAYKYIRKAITLVPKEPLNYYFLIKFLLNDDKKDEALSLAKNYETLKNVPETFEFFESKTAHTNILTFLKTHKLPKRD